MYKNIITFEFYIPMQKLPFLQILASKINFSFNMKFINMESLEDFLLNTNDVPIMIAKEYTVECFVKGHDVYQSKWEAKVDSELKTCHETRPSALVEDKHAVALKHSDVAVGHVAQFLLKTTYFYLNHVGYLLVKIIQMNSSPKTFLKLGTELPTFYVFKSTNVVMHSRLPGLVSDPMKIYNDAKSKILKAKDKPQK